MFGGLRVLIDKTLKYKLVKRTWKERLFSLPWKPFLKWKSVPDGYMIDNDKMYRTKDSIIMNPITYDFVSKQIPEVKDNKTNRFINYWG